MNFQLLSRSRRKAMWLSAYLALTSTLLSAGQGTNPTITGDPVFKAMVDELNRSVVELQLSNLDKPYFVQYIVLDEEEFAARATFGALTQATPSKQRLIYSQVRVGNYDFDNTEYNAGGAGGGAGTGRLYQGPLDDDYDSLRHTLWLATDASYKSAIEVIAQKRASIQNRTQEERVPDFSKESAAVAVSERKKLEYDRAKIENQLRQWSQIFREFPNIQSSAVSVRARLNHRYVVNSEGTRTMAPELLVILQASATAQAADGMVVSHSVPVYVRDFSDLPSTDAYTSAIRQMAKELTALREAPPLEADYSGPALLVGQVATEMFARVLGPNLTGHRGPLTRNGQSATPPLEDRMNRPILPAYISVVDDPTIKTLSNRKLIGYYSHDDQGVPSKRVSLVEGGLLTDFLMSRRPGKGRLMSNGHGRNGYPGRESPQVGNLIVTAKDGKSAEDLKKELIKTAKEERLEYGILIRASSSGGSGPIGTPVMTYRVKVSDGKEELVRVAGAGGISVQALRHLVAVGNDSTAANRLAGTSG
ncbi:MAG TPA: metallopeptidase TldD-related protein, partial [Terriglobia bacterium]|nr:metallopeptidase TldD-related protein [Terriglobia bacterium]